MLNDKYSLRYIPRYEGDLNGIVDYIVFKLYNPTSAMKLIDKIENAILKQISGTVLHKEQMFFTYY